MLVDLDQWLFLTTVRTLWSLGEDFTKNHKNVWILSAISKPSFKWRAHTLIFLNVLMVSLMCNHSWKLLVYIFPETWHLWLLLRARQECEDKMKFIGEIDWLEKKSMNTNKLFRKYCRAEDMVQWIRTLVHKWGPKDPHLPYKEPDVTTYSYDCSARGRGQRQGLLRLTDHQSSQRAPREPSSVKSPV